MNRRLNPSNPIVLAAGIIIAGAAIFAAGFAVRAVTSGGTSSAPQSVIATPATGTLSPSATPPSPTSTATLAPAAPSEPPPPEPTPIPTATPDFTAQPAVDVVSVIPALATHIETASVDIAIAVSYQAGRDSNVLTWTLLYCASPDDCNTYGSRLGIDIQPGSSGGVTLGAPFAAGGNYLRPIVVCQYTVEIGHYLTPEARWQSQLANDPRCHPAAPVPRVKVLGVTPDLGAAIRAGDLISVNLEYDAGPATRVEARYSVDKCAGDLFAFRSAEVKPGTSGVVTIIIPVTAETTGVLRHIEAQLFAGATAIASYAFGPC